MWSWWHLLWWTWLRSWLSSSAPVWSAFYHRVTVAADPLWYWIYFCHHIKFLDQSFMPLSWKLGVFSASSTAAQKYETSSWAPKSDRKLLLRGATCPCQSATGLEDLRRKEGRSWADLASDPGRAWFAWPLGSLSWGGPANRAPAQRRKWLNSRASASHGW